MQELLVKPATFRLLEQTYKNHIIERNSNATNLMRDTLLSQNYVNELLTLMVNFGLLEKTRDKKDRKRKNITLTKKGLLFCERFEKLKEVVE